MLQTYDAGSLPFTGDDAAVLRGAQITPFMEALHPARYAKDKQAFERAVQAGFLDKVRAGIDIPTYPQFRDMNEMFLTAIAGIEKTGQGYRVREPPALRRDGRLIPEVSALKDHSRELSEEIGTPLRIRLCVTGPYTLASFFPQRDSALLSQLGAAIAQIVESDVFTNRFGGVELVALDEPVFGFVDDPLLDRGAEGRDALVRAWEQICRTGKMKGAQACIHLHNTSNPLFWEIQSLDVIESHVDDALYTAQRTRALLETEDKFLKASIAVTRFDALIRDAIQQTGIRDEAALNTQVGETWTAFRKAQRNPIDFLERVEPMVRRLKQVVNLFGVDRVPYAGPECGLQSFPTYASAVECLRRTARAVETVNTEISRLPSDE